MTRLRQRIGRTLAVAALAVTAIGASAPADAAEHAATEQVPELVEAQERADAVVSAYVQTYGRLAELQDELTAVRTEIPVLERRVGRLHARIQRRAAELYKDKSSGGGLAIFDDDPQTAARRADLGRAMAKGDTSDADRLRETKARLDGRLATLEVAESEQDDLLALLELQYEAIQAGLLEITGGVATGARLCPVQGPVLFTNDWGQPRSGDRTHKGTDIFSASGAENTAVVAGRITQAAEDLGGLVVYLHGDDGHVYYYAHLSRFEGRPRRVAPGEVVGYTGDTGNAIGGTPHTHFEVHEHGTAKVNPYPIVRGLCRGDATGQ